MSNIKNAEEQVYLSMLRGELEIDSQGRIWRIGKRGWDRWKKQIRTNKCKRVRAEHRLPSGYLQIRAMIDGVRYNALAHRLVWRHMVGSIPMGLVMNHKNGIKSDNRLSNLEVVTRSENAQHAVRVLKVGPCADQDGEKNHRAKLTAKQVAEIRKRRAKGELLRIIAADFDVNFQTISKIARGDRWVEAKND